jgi:hypothetical protein
VDLTVVMAGGGGGVGLRLVPEETTAKKGWASSKTIFPLSCPIVKRMSVPIIRACDSLSPAWLIPSQCGTCAIIHFVFFILLISLYSISDDTSAM